MKKFFVFAKNLKLETVKYIFKIKCFMSKSFCEKHILRDLLVPI